MERWSWRASTEALVGFYELARAVHERFDRPRRRARALSGRGVRPVGAGRATGSTVGAPSTIRTRTSAP
jgi:hypothetical protein